VDVALDVAAEPIAQLQGDFEKPKPNGIRTSVRASYFLLPIGDRSDSLQAAVRERAVRPGGWV